MTREQIKAMAAEKVQRLRDLGLSEREIRDTINLDTISSEISMQMRYTGHSSVVRNFYKRHVTRKFLRGQMMAAGASARMADNIIAIAQIAGDPYEKVWHDIRVGTLARQIDIKRNHFIESMFGGDDE